MQFEGKPLAQLTAEDLKRVPTPLLLGMLKFHYYNPGGMSQVEHRSLIIAEARGRSLKHWTLDHFDPPNCACGGKGLYIVGTKTYCKKCKPGAVQQRKLHGRFYEAKQGRISESLDTKDSILRAKNRLSQLAKSRA